jgi:hypothetical protein
LSDPSAPSARGGSRQWRPPSCFRYGEDHEDGAAGEEHIRGTWAQVRIGAAIAHLLRGQLDGTADELASVLDMPPEFRIATVTGLLADLDARLAHGLHADSAVTASIRRQIRDFTAGALPSYPKETA